MSLPSGLTIKDFLLEVSPQYKDFVSQAHDLLTQANHKPKYQIRRYGFTAQYTSPATKRLALQLFTKDGTLFMYLYSGFIYRHDALFHMLPPCVLTELVKNHNCTSCGSSCATKHPCTINGKPYNKCLNGRTLFAVNDDTTMILPLISAMFTH